MVMVMVILIVIVIVDFYVENVSEKIHFMQFDSQSTATGRAKFDLKR